MKAKTHKNKVYGSDKYIMYNFHKVTNLSLNPEKSCEAIQNILGKNNVSKIHSPPDKVLAKRGIKWVRCLKGMEGEFHFVLPWKIKYYQTLKKIILSESKKTDLIKDMFVDAHVGMYVPDLVPIIKNCEKYNYLYYIAKRADSMNQMYIRVPYSLIYLEVDSLNLDLSKVPNVKEYDFAYSSKIDTAAEKKYQKTLRKKKSYRKK